MGIVKTLCLLPLLSIKEGETYELLQDIKWITKMGSDDIIFELDAKVIVDSFNNSSRDLS